MDPLHSAESGMEGVDQLGQLSLPAPRRHRQRGDRDSVADPDAGVASEEQVGEGADQEVVGPVKGGDQTASFLHLVVAQTNHHDLGQLSRSKIAEITHEELTERVAETNIRDGVLDGLRACCWIS